MAQDEVSLYNLALSSAGARSSISHPDERSREAEICRLWYPAVRRQILRAAPWSVSKAVSRLAQLAERTENEWVTGLPHPEYRFAYGLPENFLHPRYLASYARFEISLLSTTQRALNTNDVQTILYYTVDQPLISIWDPDLYLAIAMALSAYICLPLSGKVGQARNAQQQANALILQARETAANESYDLLDSSLDILQASGSSRYIYPAGPMIAVPNV